MKHFSIPFILSLLCSAPGLATIDFRTLIRDVLVDGRDEVGGEIALNVSGDDFAAAGPNNPIFFRFRLDHGVQLSRTLVDLDNPQEPHRPIHLALVILYDGQGSPPTINAPADAVSIVRWRRGESAFWLRVNYSSSLWIVRNGTPQPPNFTLPVEFRLGLTVEGSLNFAGVSAVSAKLANLPANQYADGPFADTTLHMNMHNSNLESFPAPPANTLVRFDLLAFALNFQDLITIPDPSLIPSSLLFILFSGDREIARGAGYSPDRWLFHITRVGAGFTSSIYLQNLSNQSRALTLQSFDIEGFPLELVHVDIEPGEIVRESAATFFDSSEVSHVRISGHQSVAASVGYRVASGPGLTAHLHETRNAGTGYLIYPVDRSLGFDGVAAVNLGDAPANVRVELVDLAGQVTGELDLTAQEAFPVNSKKLWVLSALTEDPDFAAMRLISDQPLGTVFLRGNNNGQGSLNLFELSPIPLPD